MDLICPICESKLNTLNKSLVCAGITVSTLPGKAM